MRQPQRHLHDAFLAEPHDGAADPAAWVRARVAANKHLRAPGPHPSPRFLLTAAASAWAAPVTRRDNRFNQITNIDPAWVPAQAKLKVLNLEHNQLTSGSLTPAVRAPLKLNALSLAHNHLTTVPSWIYEHATCVTHCADGRSRQAGRGQRATDSRAQNGAHFFGYVGAVHRSLERLYLNTNALRELPDGMSGLRSLRFLSVDHNQLQHVQVIVGLPNLTGIGLAFNHIAVKPDFQSSVQVVRVEGNPWLVGTEATAA